jgi:hypothetical protein
VVLPAVSWMRRYTVVQVPEVGSQKLKSCQVVVVQGPLMLVPKSTWWMGRG